MDDSFLSIGCATTYSRNIIMPHKLGIGDVVEITRVHKKDSYTTKEMKGRKVKIDYLYDPWKYDDLKGYKSFGFEAVDGKLPSSGYFFAVRVKRIS